VDNDQLALQAFKWLSALLSDNIGKIITATAFVASFAFESFQMRVEKLFRTMCWLVWGLLYVSVDISIPGNLYVDGVYAYARLWRPKGPWYCPKCFHDTHVLSQLNPQKRIYNNAIFIAQHCPKCENTIERGEVIQPEQKDRYQIPGSAGLY
jgi:hypothetical protein